MKQGISQTEANKLVYDFLDNKKKCMTKERIIEQMILPKTVTGTALTYLRKKKKVGIFRIGGWNSKTRKTYWGVIYNEVKQNE